MVVDDLHVDNSGKISATLAYVSGDEIDLFEIALHQTIRLQMDLGMGMMSFVVTQLAVEWRFKERWLLFDGQLR